MFAYGSKLGKVFDDNHITWCENNNLMIFKMKTNKAVYITFTTNLSLSIFINCSDMFRPRLLVTFRELAKFFMCNLWQRFYIYMYTYIYMCVIKIIIKIKILYRTSDTPAAHVENLQAP
jgi:hypothetical protein